MNRLEFWSQRYNKLYYFVLDRVGQEKADKLATEYAYAATCREAKKQFDKGNTEW